MNNDGRILSPLTGLDNVKLLNSIDSTKIKEDYKKQFNIDVAKYFSDVPLIYLYECLDTHYKFYFPFHTSGDRIFYEELNKFSWYYMEWKWEFEIVRNLINKGEKVLEVGSGNGDFLKGIKNRTDEAIGLELNEDAPRLGLEKGVTIKNISIEQYSLSFPNYYDMVCTFQVVEHISNIKDFLIGCLRTLKLDGKLIISVPNNDSFLKYSDAVLNSPPHHMGLWNKNSLENLQNILPVKLINVFYEPLQKYHYLFFIQVMLKRYKIYNKYIVRILNLKLVKKIIELIMNLFAKKIKGHTILAIYKKIK